MNAGTYNATRRAKQPTEQAKGTRPTRYFLDLEFLLKGGLLASPPMAGRNCDDRNTDMGMNEWKKK